jgi:hypothetical protein
MKTAMKPWQGGGRVSNSPTLDSNESVFFLRQLEHIKTQVIDIEYPAMKARKLLPVSNEAGPGAQYITWRQFDRTGSAKLIRDYSADLPRVDVIGSEFINNPVRSIGASFGYNVQEIRSAQYTGFPLDTRRAMTCGEAIRREENELAFFGDDASGLVGFLNNPNMTEIVLPSDGAGSSQAFSTKTADQLLRDLNLLSNSIVELTKEIEQPDTILLPVKQYNILATKRIGIDSNMTVLKFFLETNPYIKDIEPLVQLSNAGGTSVDRAICYERNPMKLTLEVPMDVQQYEPEKRNLEYVVPMESRFGGVLIYKPLSIAYADGI